MRTDRTQRGLVRRFVCLVVVLLVCFGSGLSAAPAAVAEDKPKWHLDYGPDSGKKAPNDWSGGSTVGIDNKGHYCLYDEIDDTSICRLPEAGEMPGTVDICEGADGTGARNCSEEGRHAFEKRRLEKWRKNYPNKADDPNYEKLNKFITDCVNKGGIFRECQREGGDKYPPKAKTPFTWAAGKISEMASNALQEAARYIGKSVVWLLEEFAKVFNDSSTIDLSKTGIGKPKGIMTVLSLLIATFLLLLQFGKVAISQRGEPAATAVMGLAKWGIISSVYVIATQTALTWSDAVSTWIINYSFHGGGSGAGDATKAMQQQLGALFGGLITGGGGAATVGTALITGEGVTAAAVGVIIVVGIVCILAIAALWIEVLLRQAGIMILVATMPVVLAGQMSDSTQEWWPKARNALIALVLMKPMIVLCFAIGFGAMSEGDGVQNMFVGLVIFVLACFAWPVLAKFMTFSTVGGERDRVRTHELDRLVRRIDERRLPARDGRGRGGRRRQRLYPRPGAGQRPGLRQRLQRRAERGQQHPGRERTDLRIPGHGHGRPAPAGPRRGQGHLESGMASTAGHAGLDHGAAGGRHVVIAQRRHSASAGQPQEADDGAQRTLQPVQPPSPPTQG